MIYASSVVKIRKSSSENEMLFTKKTQLIVKLISELCPLDLLVLFRTTLSGVFIIFCAAQTQTILSHSSILPLGSVSEHQCLLFTCSLKSLDQAIIPRAVHCFHWHHKSLGPISLWLFDDENFILLQFYFCQSDHYK